MAVQTYNYIFRGYDKDWTDLNVHRASGGFEAVKKALSMDKDAIVDEVKRANLRGRGGAGFPAGVKWGFVPKVSEKPKYLVVNADEGEPGTFKDRYWLKWDPYPLIEGCIICSFALDIHTCYIYIRGEFAEEIAIVEAAIDRARKAGLLGRNLMGTGFDLEIYTHTGAGAYICGEETALLNSLEGKAGQPRLKPPFPAVEGLFACPTVVNNVETLVNVPQIIKHGADWFNSHGTERNGGTKVFCVSGHVKRPGLYEVKLGTNLKDIIYDLCGGILDDRPLKGVIPGGSSCPIIRPDEIDIPADFDSFKAVGSMLGTAGVMVIAEPTCLVQVLLRISRFYAHESCGQCTPCREGTGWLYRIIKDIEKGVGKHEHIDLLEHGASRIEGNTICALGDAAAWPVRSFVKKYRSEFERHIELGRCPYKAS
ncbi:MAG: NADH-quinone oxidoreductase, F subunit NuoF [Myxococcales bacterium]